MSWYDCKDLGSVSIARSITLQNPSAQIDTLGAILLLRKKNSGWVGTAKCL